MTAASDTVLLRSLGVSFAMNGRDVSLFVPAFYGSSFALLGWLFGRLAEARRAERAAAQVMSEQTEWIVRARARLAESEKLAALGQLAGTIAHEVRNPLAVIRSTAQGLDEDLAATRVEARRAIGFILEEVDRLNGVVSSILEFAKPVRLRTRPAPLDEILGRAVLLASEEIATHHIKLERLGPPHDLLVDVDPDLLQQVVLGLVLNAVASRPGGRVWLEAERCGDGVEIRVADDGPGVPLDLRDRVFEPFFTTREHGTGLGLAIAKQIIGAHRGTIALDERPGGGARFVVRLPGCVVHADRVAA